ncbi:MAG: hypothetical protein R2882_08860 [Gemmatimonadales bacterium]
MHSFLGVPIVAATVLGNLYLTEKIGAATSPTRTLTAMLLASIVASAVEKCPDHERSTWLLEEVQQLHRSRNGSSRW